MSSKKLKNKFKNSNNSSIVIESKWNSSYNQLGINTAAKEMLIIQIRRSKRYGNSSTKNNK